MFINNLKIAFRSLFRRRTFTFINILGLSLSMVAAFYSFLWVQNEFTTNHYHEKADSLYRINATLNVGNGNIWYWSQTSYALQEVIKNEVPEVIQSALIYEDTWRKPSLRKNAMLLSTKKFAYVSENWFDFFDYQFVLGTDKGFSEQVHGAIITQNLAERLFGKVEVIGETFQLDTTQLRVHAVIENHPPNSSFNHELILTLNYYLSSPARKEQAMEWGEYNFQTFVEVRKDADISHLNETLTRLTQKYKEDKDVELSVMPFVDIYFDNKWGNAAMQSGDRQATITFGIIGLIILFLACVNYVSLTTAQAGMRTKAIGVRKIIGARGRQLFSLFFTESFLMTLTSLLISLAFIQLLLPHFNTFTEKNFQLPWYNPVMWMVGGGIFLSTLLLSGIYPALFLTNFSPANFLRGKNFLKLKNTTFRKGLVVFQFALTIGLIIGAIVIFQQQDFIRKKDLGFDRSPIFEFQVPFNEKREQSIKTMLPVLATATSVEGTTVSNASVINMNGVHGGSLDWEGKAADFTPMVGQMAIDANFGDVLNLDLVSGRWFLEGDVSDNSNVIVNESLVELFQLSEPAVGQRFSFHGKEGQIIGVVKDFNYRNLRDKIGPLVLYKSPRSYSNIMLKTKEGQVTTAIAAAEKVWKQHYPNRPFEYQFLDEKFNHSYQKEQKAASLFKVLASLAIFISCLGLFGLAVFSTEQRRKEIGIRKVLGASLFGLIALLSKDFIKLILLAIIIASPVAYYFLEQWLQDFAYRIGWQWWIFATAGMGLLLIAFLTVSVQSAKAALANPIKSLRSE